MSRRLRELRGDEGFTLIELLIVVIILAILAAIVVFAVGATGTNAAVASCNSDAKSVETALEAYKAQTGAYPATLGALTTTTVVNSTTAGPWLRQTPTSPHYTISYDGSGGVYVYSGSAYVNFDTAANACASAK